MSEQEIQKPKKRQFLFNPLKKPLPYAGLILAVLIIIFQSTIRQYTANLVGNWLADNIREKTGGLYNLDYNFVRLDIFTKELRIKDLSITLDTTAITRKAYLDQYSNLVDLHTPLVVLKLHSLWDLLVNNQLLVAYIGIQEPRVNLIHSDLPQVLQEANQEKSAENLRDFLQEIQIDSFRVTHGGVNLELKDRDKHGVLNLTIRDFSMLSRGFKLDKIDPKKLLRGIYAKEIYLEVNDQEFALPAARHRFGFRKFILSTPDSLIRFDSLQVSPLPAADSVAKARIFLKKLQFTGINFERAYLEDIMDIEDFLIEEPDIRVDLSLVSPQPRAAEDTAATSLKLPFHAINLGHFSLKRGNLLIDQAERLSLRNLHFDLHDIHFDTLVTTPQQLVERLGHFNFRTDSLNLFLPDSIHRLTAGYVHISSRDSTLLAHDLRLSPRPERRSYRLYKQHGVRFVNFASIRTLAVSGVDFSLALQQQKFLADTLMVVSPRVNTTEYRYIKPRQKASGGQPAGFFINKVIVKNAVVNHNKPAAGQSQRTLLNGADLVITHLYPEVNGPAFDSIRFTIREGSSELRDIRHNLHFRSLSGRNLRDFYLGSFELRPDSARQAGNLFDLRGQGLQITGFDRHSLARKQLKIGSVTAENLVFDGRLEPAARKAGSSRKKPGLNRVLINRIFLKKSMVALQTPELQIDLNELSTRLDSLNLDLTDSQRLAPLLFHDLRIAHSDFRVANRKNNTVITGHAGWYSETDSVISFNNVAINTPEGLHIRLKELGLYGLDRQALLDTAGIRFRYFLAYKPAVSLRIPEKDSLEAPAASRPVLSSDSLRQILLSRFAYLDFDSILIRQGQLAMHNNKRHTELQDINLTIGPYHLDSATRTSRLLRPGRFDLHIARLTSNSRQDSLEINSLDLDLLANRLLTGPLQLIARPGNSLINARVPGLYANGFHLEKFLKNDFSMDTVRVSGGTFTLLTPTDTLEGRAIDKTESNYIRFIEKTFRNISSKSWIDTMKMAHLTIAETYNIKQDTLKKNRLGALLARLKISPGSKADTLTTDTLMAGEPLAAADTLEQEQPASDTLMLAARPTDTTMAAPAGSHGFIRHIRLANSRFIWKQDTTHHPFLSQLDFNITVDGLLLDSLRGFNVFSHINNLVVNVNNYTTLLPGELNMIKAGNIRLNTRNHIIEINNFSLIPQVNKYEYALKVGHQASWQHLQDLNIRLEGINLPRLLTNRGIQARKVAVFDGKLDIFRDKELPIPADQHKPMPQEALRNLKMPVLIDSVTLENFQVNVTNRLNSRMPEGSIFFTDINATITNVVNTDSAILARRYALASASTRIMGKGLLTAEFSFDLFDENNLFIFSGHLEGPMDAREFNSILSAMAFVKIESGRINDLKLEAKGDNYYATGNMIFLYNNLKVSTINKKNLKTTGMGKVLKTFFANTFVVKKNNPSFKFFPREGAMYYERNPQKIIFDYLTKTSLSGIVSSIGARNARKDIKRIQRESKKQKDAERRAQRKAERKGDGK